MEILNEFFFIIFFTIISTFVLLFFFKKITSFKYFESLKVQDEFFKSTSKFSAITGSGIIFLIVFLIFFLIIYLDDRLIFKTFVNLPNKYIFFFISLIFLTVLSLIDDKKKIDPIFRLLSHIIFIYSSLTCLELGKIQIPLKILFLITVVVWVYILNITNFLDGSDGLLSINAISFYVSYLILDSFVNLKLFSDVFPYILIPILLVFLLFNFPRKTKILPMYFMGDVGSIFLGFLIGFSILEIATTKYWYFGFIFFSYPIVDCTITLTKKVLRGNMPWKRLGDYFFLNPKQKNFYYDRCIVSKIIAYMTLFYCIFLNIIIFFSFYFNQLMYLFLIIFLIFIKLSLFKNKNYFLAFARLLRLI